MDVTAKIAQFVVNAKYENLPAAAIATAKIAVRDCLGVALAGSKEEDAKICAEVARQEQAKEETTVIGQGFKSSALNAALANGTAAHAMDFDHSFTLMGQPTAPIIPATFALGEALGASGRQIIEAYAVGYEVTAKLVHSLRDSEHDGWHAPSTLRIFWRRSGLQQAARAQRRPSRDGARHVGLDGRRRGGQLRHHDQAFACRPRRAQRRARRQAGAIRLHRERQSDRIGFWLLQSASSWHADRREADRRVGPVLRACSATVFASSPILAAG